MEGMNEHVGHVGWASNYRGTRTGRLSCRGDANLSNIPKSAGPIAYNLPIPVTRIVVQRRKGQVDSIQLHLALPRAVAFSYPILTMVVEEGKGLAYAQKHFGDLINFEIEVIGAY